MGARFSLARDVNTYFAGKNPRFEGHVRIGSGTQLPSASDFPAWRKEEQLKLRKFLLMAGVVPAILGASLFGACGGDDDDSGDSGGSSGSGSDEDFVSAICKAGLKFSKAMDSLEKDLKNETDFSKIAEKASEPFNDFANDFAKAKPPSDLKEWHKTTSDGLKAAAKGLEDGDFEALTDSLDLTPPEDAAERISKAAEGNKDCDEAEFSFNE
jgi:hypothetical protein